LPGHPEVNATLSYVVACQPPADPLYRYHHARRTGNDKIVRDHDAYWVTEEATSEGSPPLILERGEPVDLPPVLVIQRADDDNHPIEMPIYENLPWFPGWRFSVDPAVPDSVHVMETIARFVNRYG
jgi:hypothetical protein